MNHYASTKILQKPPMCSLAINSLPYTASFSECCLLIHEMVIKLLSIKIPLCFWAGLHMFVSSALS